MTPQWTHVGHIKSKDKNSFWILLFCRLFHLSLYPTGWYQPVKIQLPDKYIHPTLNLYTAQKHSTSILSRIWNQLSLNPPSRSFHLHHLYANLLQRSCMRCHKLYIHLLILCNNGGKAYHQQWRPAKLAAICSSICSVDLQSVLEALSTKRVFDFIISSWKQC